VFEVWGHEMFMSKELESTLFVLTRFMADSSNRVRMAARAAIRMVLHRSTEKNSIKYILLSYLPSEKSAEIEKLYLEPPKITKPSNADRQNKTLRPMEGLSSQEIIDKKFSRTENLESMKLPRR
jgi:hypothetical protein